MESDWRMNVVKYAVGFWPLGGTWPPGKDGRLVARMRPFLGVWISNMPAATPNHVQSWILDPLTGMLFPGVLQILKLPGWKNFPYGYDVEPDHA